VSLKHYLGKLIYKCCIRKCWKCISTFLKATKLSLSTKKVLLLVYYMKEIDMN